MRQTVTVSKHKRVLKRSDSQSLAEKIIEIQEHDRKYTPRGPDKIQFTCFCCSRRARKSPNAKCQECKNIFCETCIKWMFSQEWNGKKVRQCRLCQFKSKSTPCGWNRSFYMQYCCGQRIGESMNNLEKDIAKLERYEDHFNVCETCKELDAATYGQIEIE